MKTHTVLIDSSREKPVEVCNAMEEKGWAVRQIVNDHAYGTTYVVFERESDDMAYMVAPRSFTGSEAPTMAAQARASMPSRTLAGSRRG